MFLKMMKRINFIIEESTGILRSLANGSIRMLLMAVAVSMLAVSCGGSGGNRQQSAENAVSEEQEIQEQEIQGQEIDAQEEETPEEQKTWIYRDFKLKYDEKPMFITTAFTGQGGDISASQSLVRVKDKLYSHTVTGDEEGYLLFSMENGVLMMYELNPQQKVAVKSKANFRTIEGALTWNLESSVYAQTRGADPKTRIRTEEIAGIVCDVYQNEAELTKQKMDEETKGFEALAKALGGDTKELDNFKKQIGDMNGIATTWIDPNRVNLVLRKHVRITMLGRTTDAVTHNVTFFSDTDIDASEIPNMSEYHIL
jgi:hypothetical protein